MDKPKLQFVLTRHKGCDIYVENYSKEITKKQLMEIEKIALKLQKIFEYDEASK